MTAINPVASSAAAASSAATSSNTTTPNLSSTLNLSFSTYLKILTTQLQNQDPTNATDPNQFTQELVQMGGVQQQITTNQDLTQLINAQTTNSLATGVGYIGNYVGAASSSGAFSLQNSSAEMGYTLPSGASNAAVIVQDSKGNTVASFAAPATQGANYVSWNGLDNNGNQMPDGSYTFTVTAATSTGAAVTATNPITISKITAVQSNSDGTLQLIAGSGSVSTSSVNAIYTANSLPNSTALNTPIAQTQSQPSS